MASFAPPFAGSGHPTVDDPAVSLAGPDLHRLGGDIEEDSPVMLNQLGLRRESASSSSTATHSSSSHSPRSSGSSAHFAQARQRRSSQPPLPSQSAARKAQKMAMNAPLPPGAPVDFVANHHRAALAGSPHEDAPAGFLANHHRQTSAGSPSTPSSHRKSRSGGSGATGFPWSNRRSQSGSAVGNSGDSEGDQQNNGGYSSTGGTINYSPSGGIGFNALAASPPSSSSKKWLSRHRRTSNASQGSQGHVTSARPVRSRVQSGASSHKGSVVSRNAESEASINSRRAPISPKVTPSNSLRQTRSDKDSVSSQSVSQRASNGSLRIPPPSPALSEGAYSSDHSRYSNNSHPSNGSGNGKRASKTKRVHAPLATSVIPTRGSSMGNSPSPLGVSTLLGPVPMPGPASAGSGHGNGSEGSSYPTSPSVGDFPPRLALDRVPTAPLGSPRSLRNASSGEYFNTPQPLAPHVFSETENTPTPKLDRDLGFDDRRDGLVKPSASGLGTAVPEMSPGTAKLLHEMGGSAQDARTDMEAPDNAIPARDLTASVSDSSSHIPLIPMRASSSSEGAKHTRLAHPVERQGSTGLPSPSPSEDAQRLEDLYGQYGSETPEVGSQTDGRLPSFIDEPTVTMPSGHSRDASSHYDEDFATPVPASHQFHPPGGLAAPEAELGPDRSPVLDELDVMIGRAMRDVHDLGLGPSPAQAPVEEATESAQGLGVPTTEMSDSVSLAPSMEYLDAAAEPADTDDLLDQANVVPVLPVSGPVTEIAVVEVSPSATSAPQELSGDISSDYGATPTNMSPIATPQHTMPAFLDRTVVVTSPPASPSTTRRDSYSARPASTHSSSTLLMQTQWQAMQQRQAKAAELLRRNRPLPSSMDFSDIKRLRTSGERAKAYAIKINALAKEDTGLDIWIERVREQRSGQPGTTYTASKPIRSSPLSPSGQVSPPSFRSVPSFRGPAMQTQGHPRDASTAASVMTFPTRPDATRAVEIAHSTSTPANLMEPANLPYPGVYGPGQQSPLGTIPSGGSSGGNSARATPPVPSPNGLSGSPARGTPPIKAAGFLHTIGRRASRKVATRPNLQISAPVPENVFLPDSTVPVQSIRNAGLSGPRGPRTVNTASPARPVSTQLPATATPPGHSPTNTINSRTSFAYGSTRQPGKEAPVDPVFDEKMDRLMDILPQADRTMLGSILRQQHGDDLAAIGAYLEAEKHGRV